MCNCKTTPGFNEKLREAAGKTKTTGEIHVVYVYKKSGTIFIRKESELNDEMGICCYFLSDGTEVIYQKKNPETIPEENQKADAKPRSKKKPAAKIV